MASTFPTALDAFTNPTATSLLTSPNHAQQHSDLNDAVEALEAKVAIGATVLGTYTAYTPTFLNVTVGNGTVVGAYARVNNFIHVYGSLVFGTTTAFTASVSVNLPVDMAVAQSLTSMPYGLVNMRDVSTNVFYPGTTRQNGTNNSVFVAAYAVSGANIVFNVLTASTPFTWTTGDILTWNLYYRV